MITAGSHRVNALTGTPADTGVRLRTGPENEEAD